MPKNAHLKVRIGGTDRLVLLSASAERWGIDTLEGSESTFRWSTFDSVLDWVRGEPGEFAFQAFPDDVASTEEPGTVCAIVIGWLPNAVFFGYQGLEVFWGGSTTIENAMRILDAVAALRAQTLEE